MAGTQPAGCQKFRESREYHIFPENPEKSRGNPVKLREIPKKSRDFSGKPREIPGDFRKIPGNSGNSRKSPQTQEMFRKFSQAQHASGQGECVKTFVFIVFSAQKIFRKIFSWFKMIPKTRKFSKKSNPSPALAISVSISLKSV